jgi:hypothetical protein
MELGVARAMGTDRGPVADLLGEHDYSLHCADSDGSLALLTDPSFGSDVFARPSL